MDCMKDDIMSDKFRRKSFLSKTIIKENFKRCRKSQGNNRKNIWIIGAKDRRYGMIVMPICYNNWNRESFDKIIYLKTLKNTTKE